ncbi:MAG: hypothetical protein GWO20_06170, partial [Candidatus Korarchaeota archaeon]|nr:hypothetical protein [Candidatus Korarchaeota archaeon]
MQILYDRDWSLTNTKLLMTKIFSSPERVEIRTKAHIVESDVYLSRATSAFSREDFQSAHISAIVTLECIIKVLVEIALEYFSNSQFIQKLDTSTKKFRKHKILDEYLHMSLLEKANDETVEEKLKLFKTIWDEMNFTTNRHRDALEASHFKIKTELKYYLNPAFLQGMIMRTKSIINSGKM